VAAVTFLAIVGAAGFRSTPAVLMVPLSDEFGWSRTGISVAVTVNLLLFGLTAPFAAALMERFGVRRVVTVALLTVAVGSALTVFMSSLWQLVLCWGVLVGLGTGSMALVLASTVAGRWFVRQRGLVTGALTAGSATGQLAFLPVLAWLATYHGWRAASLVVAGAALAVVPFVLWRLRDWPEDLGVRPYGEDPSAPVPAHRGSPGGAVAAALGGLRDGLRSRTFWVLAVTFFICGATTNGLVGTHLIPAAHDHGMAETTAAGLLALVGIFDVVGTIASGWLTDRVDSRRLLFWYYGLRGGSLLLLPTMLSASVHPQLLVFIVFYGLDWVATVPPTVALCRQTWGPQRSGVMFGWVFASHQIGAGLTAAAAGAIRTHMGDYTVAWIVAGGLALLAAGLIFLADPRNPGQAFRMEPALSAE
jgi:MFS family permease